MTISNLEQLAECFLESVTFDTVFEDSRSPSKCIKGSLGAIFYDARNSRFTFRRFGSIRKYINFQPNDTRQLTTAAHACGLTFGQRDQREQRQRVNTSLLPALKPTY
jgi:hypothetical protein